MTIGIIVYSQTGNTFSVAQKLALRLSDAGHTASIIAVETAGEVPPAQRPTLKEIPDVSGYDAVVFGSPVHAFSLSPAMTVCMEQIASLSGKRTGLFVTQQLPFAWMGGNRARKQMQALCAAKGGQVYACGGINWSRKNRDAQIDALCASLAAL